MITRRWHLALLLPALMAEPALAQQSGPVVGVLVGPVRNELVWSPRVPIEKKNGMSAGAFLYTQPPVRWLGLVAEGIYIQRGGTAELDIGGIPTTAGLRTHYLSAAVHARLQRDIGPVRVHLLGGPTVDQILSNQLDPVLAQVFDGERMTVFSATWGAGLGGWVAEGFWLGADVRQTRNLSDAHDGAFTSVRNRTTEFVVRGGVPLSRLRNR